jgi:hypothetical protein
MNEAAKNPLKGGDLLGLYGDYKDVITSVHQVDGVAVVDTFKVHDTVTCNDFAMTPVMVNRPGNQQDSAKSTYGIWIRLSYINHSCLPNSQEPFMATSSWRTRLGQSPKAKKSHTVTLTVITGTMESGQNRYSRTEVSVANAQVAKLTASALLRLLSSALACGKKLST